MNTSGRQKTESWFSATVSPLLSKMVEAMVIERPDDPRAWIADYMMERDEGSAGNSRPAGRDQVHESRRTPPPHSNTNGSCWASPRQPPPNATDSRPASEEMVEADTEQPEEISDLNALLLPSGILPLDVERFSVSYSRALLEGWVRQESPCCAAASIAGAWNALSGKPRGAEGALSNECVLRAMRSVVEEQISCMVARFERLLGASLEPLLQALDAELAVEGKHLGGRGPKAAVANGPHLLRLTRAITTRERERVDHPATFDLLWELYEEERKEAADADAVAAATAAAEAVATAISVGSAAAAATNSRSMAGRPRGVGLSDGGGAGQMDAATGGEGFMGSAGEIRTGVGMEEGTSKVSGQASVDVPPASQKAEGNIAAATGAEKKVPRRPSTGRSRVGGGGGGADNTLGDFRSGSALRRPLSTGDMTSAGVLDGGDRRGPGEGPSTVRLCWGGDEEGRADDEVWMTSGERALEQEAGEAREEDEQQERDEEEGSEEELGGGMLAARRKCSSGRSAEKGNTTQRKQRRKSRKESTGGSRKGARDCPRASEGRRATVKTPWRWKKDLCTLLKRMAGLEKLCATRPSTAAIGNLGLISTVRYLDGTVPGNAEMTARLFMGKGRRHPSSRLQVPLSYRDDDQDKAKQWAALREAFLSDRQVLLFHLTNHYALIFGLREWRSSSSSWCRIIDTAVDPRGARSRPSNSRTDAIQPTPNGKNRSGSSTININAASTGFASSNNDIDDVCERSGEVFPRREIDAMGTPTASKAGTSRAVITQETCDIVVGRGDEKGGSESNTSGGNRAIAGDSGWKRQILTARRGQRPTAWMDFEEARRILLGWEGYTIMAVEQGKAEPEPPT